MGCPLLQEYLPFRIRLFIVNVMESLRIKEAVPFQPLPPLRRFVVLRKLLVILRSFVFGGVLLLAIAETSKRSWSVPERLAPIAQDVVPAYPQAQPEQMGLTHCLRC
jgi:hypothetical protein